MQTIQFILTQMGVAVVGSIWQAAILWIFYKSLVTIGTFKAETKFRLALAISLSGAVWFIFSICTHIVAVPGYINSAIVPGSRLLPESVAMEVNAFLGAAYLAIMAFYVVKGKSEWATLRQFKSSAAVKAPPGLRLFVERYASWMDIPRKVTLVVSSLDVPATFGWLKPVILLPAACITRLSTPQLEAILLHELAHIRRNDYLWGMLLYGSEKLLWFNPFLLSLVKEARQEAENACDDWVVQFEFCPKNYAFALLQIAKTQSGYALALSAGGNNDLQLLGRIKRILGLPTTPRKPGWKEVLSGCLLIFLSLQLIVFNSKQKSLNMVKPAGMFATARFKDNNQYWEQSLVQARLSILEAAVGKNGGGNEKEKSTSLKNSALSLRLSKAQMDRKMIDRELELSGVAREGEAHPLMLSAGWANDRHDENDDESLDIAWDGFELLLEKLETQGRLEEAEWRELTEYIAYHAEIKQAIYKDAGRQRSPLLEAVDHSQTQNPDEILLIVYDEATGTLAASLVNKNQFADEYQIAEVPKDEQQVIFLNKKAKNHSKIISL